MDYGFSTINKHKVKQLLERECVDTDIGWLENSNIEGIDPYLAAQILKERKSRVESPVAEDLYAPLKFRIDINVLPQPEMISVILDIAEKINSVGKITENSSRMIDAYLHFQAVFCVKTAFANGEVDVHDIIMKIKDLIQAPDAEISLILNTPVITYV